MSFSADDSHGPLFAERLAAASIHKLQQLAEVDPRRLETISQRHYPFGVCPAAPILLEHSTLGASPIGIITPEKPSWWLKQHKP